MSIILRSTLGSLAVLPFASVLACGCSNSSSTAPPDAGADHSVSDGQAESAADTSTTDSGETAHVLIVDQYNNRVIEVTRDTPPKIVWSFGNGSSVPGAHSVVAPNDARRLLNGQTLIAGSGAGAGTEPTCDAGCQDNRVIIVDDDGGTIAWQYGENGGLSGSGPNQLNVPVSAVLVPGTGDGGVGDHILISDQANNRIIEVDKATKQIAWQFPPVASSGDAGSGEGGDASSGDAGDAGTSNLTLSNPNSAERLANGHTLIADEMNNRVIEVTNAGTIFWQYPETPNLTLLNVAGFASRLSNGHTLITDTNNNRVIEVEMDGTVFWSYSTANRNPNMSNPQPSFAVRLANGNTLITDQFNDQVIEVTSTTPAKIVFTYGQIGVAGNGPGQLNTPYHATDVGDYTGLTAP